ncbi:DUF1211 domain-containing protein [Deinococcus sp. KNUC1210]|uniref:TMEM175 family protein n=1 Tax=Deinococcus sp. KNUC1210 TaxID=2917691 RepID=UPI001EF0D5EC|nr:TMEM175 family protein [Deinococcus sp. KNUC1210]ULH14602.1 DUF1211 domain-containing protein [Deinococcus sp. KNUC1210]
MLAPPPSSRELGRLEAFSDGIFAIAVTLLVLDIKVPHLHAATPALLLNALSSLWPSVLTFVISFVTITIIWIGHHDMIRRAHFITPRILIANSALLLLVTFIPFPTALLSEYLETPAAPIVCALYAAVGLIAALIFTALYSVLYREGYLPAQRSSEDVYAFHVRKNIATSGVYVVAAGVAFLSPLASLLLLLATWVYWGLSI